MCGRYTLSTPADLIADLFEVEALPGLEARYNVAPTQEAPILRADQEGNRSLSLARWGLIPFWAKDPAIGNRMINARAETVAEKPAYRTSFRRRRCGVIADGFYEWQRTAGRKQPYLLRLKGGPPFAIAGLWDRWEGVDAGAVESFTLITTRANELAARVHERMPVILDREGLSRWLQGGEPEALLELLEPFPEERMEAFAVSTFVNNPANDSPRCIEPLASG